MSQTARTALVLVAGAALGATLTFGSSVFAEKSPTATLPMEELRTFAEVFGKIKADYVEQVDDKTLLSNAISGMLSGLDPHSTFLDQDAFKELQMGTTGEFGGLGIEVGMEDGFVKVISPIDDTPAARAGVQSGDLIIRLDDTPVKGMSLSEAVKMMRGHPGSPITLTIVRQGADAPIKVSVTRDIIKVRSVKSRDLGDGFGYVRLSNFQTQTGEQMRDALNDLKSKHNGQLKGLVLDLRNNPGGVLGAAVSVADAFMEKGLIVYTEGRASDSELRFSATPDDILKGSPIVVLVNGGSASASEIVAGALQDSHRAVIMGAQTFGKGSVQTIFPMSNSTGVKLTTARYYTPSGRSIQAEGIKPDIVLKQVKVDEVADAGAEGLKEADLSRHLRNGKGEKGEKGDSAAKAKAKAIIDKETKNDGKDGKDGKDEKGQVSGAPADITKRSGPPTASEDFGLYQAYNLLKGLSIVQAAR